MECLGGYLERDSTTFGREALQWMRIKMLVNNKTGSTIYWYVDSWDGLGRYSKTDVMSFVLVD